MNKWIKSKLKTVSVKQVLVTGVILVIPGAVIVASLYLITKKVLDVNKPKGEKNETVL